jgi:catechol 2,3-dioxygenase-like lactoylglutathione lyase family enzyme
LLVDVLHFSFTVSDIERSVAWYTECLGLELVDRQRQDSAYTGTLVGMPKAVLEVARFDIPGRTRGPSGHLLELIQYVRPEGSVIPLLTNSPGVAHLAFIVDDIHERYQRMHDGGVQFRNSPVAITTGTNAGGWACYCSGPDGETLELLQLPPGRLQAAAAIRVGKIDA